MDEQDAVTQEAEETAATDSAPVETETADTQEAPAGESAQPEKKVSDAVPYERFSEVNNRARQLEEENARLRRFAESANKPASPASDPLLADLPFDPDTLKGLDRYYEVKRQREIVEEETRKVERFASRHSEELQDPILRGTMATFIQEANARGEYMDHEEALTKAKDALEARVKPAAERAEKAGFDEAAGLAKTKNKLGGVDAPAKTAPPVDEEKMSYQEFVNYHKIPRKN